MIRKSIIAVLTLATVGSVVWPTMANPGRSYRWEISDGQAIEVQHYGRDDWLGHMSLGYFEIGSYKPFPYLSRSWGGFRFVRAPAYANPNVKEMVYLVRVPSWFPVLVFGTYPAIAFIRGSYRRGRRRSRGQCLDCGYDLTGNRSGLCSECGTEIEQP